MTGFLLSSESNSEGQILLKVSWESRMKLIKANVLSRLLLCMHNNPLPNVRRTRTFRKIYKAPQLGKLGVMSCCIIRFILVYNEASYIMGIPTVTLLIEGNVTGNLMRNL